jgi:hypothetical protein
MPLRAVRGVEGDVAMMTADLMHQLEKSRTVIVHFAATLAKSSKSHEDRRAMLDDAQVALEAIDATLAFLLRFRDVRGARNEA